MFLFNRTLFSTGEMPRVLKKAIVTPILKKPNLDKDDLSNYRPVSNLPFILKTMEKMVASRVTKYVKSNRLMSRSQSAYRRFHLTETDLLRLLSDLTFAVESGRIALLALLDMSAAFDTVDHSILLCRLDKTYGIRDGALRWIESYLTDRTQQVCIQGTSSNDVPLLYGVPRALFWVVYC